MFSSFWIKLFNVLLNLRLKVKKVRNQKEVDKDGEVVIRIASKLYVIGVGSEQLGKIRGSRAKRSGR
jgi:hypothetical protein